MLETATIGICRGFGTQATFPFVFFFLYYFHGNRVMYNRRPVLVVGHEGKSGRRNWGTVNGEEGDSCTSGAGRCSPDHAGSVNARGIRMINQTLSVWNGRVHVAFTVHQYTKFI